MIENVNEDRKRSVLKAEGFLNPKSDDVKDELFQHHEFFDSRDMLQVKYEMIRRVEAEGWSISKATETFGLSRPSYYEAKNTMEKDGLPGLIPQKRGPKRAHKLSDEIVTFVQQALKENKQLRASNLTLQIEKKFGVRVHSRSIERALARKKNTL
ncbi:MAG: helix-turn-helix domain containing protein [SAR324 cluster bacterium]|nr:helix-turn-helix domain containing protein [SAR324 cluster bacterium]